jgi:hypothetical protein
MLLQFRKDTRHITYRPVSYLATRSDTNTHASFWTVLLNMKQVVQAKGKELLCSMR